MMTSLRYPGLSHIVACLDFHNRLWTGHSDSSLGFFTLFQHWNHSKPVRSAKTLSYLSYFSISLSRAKIFAMNLKVLCYPIFHFPYAIIPYNSSPYSFNSSHTSLHSVFQTAQTCSHFGIHMRSSFHLEWTSLQNSMDWSILFFSGKKREREREWKSLSRV